MTETSFILSYLTGTFPYSTELAAFGIAFQGALAVRNGRNKDGKMHWFHAFALSTILGFGGSWLGFIWMGKPSSMITNGDVNIMACIIAYVLANHTPYDVGYRLAHYLPVEMLITSLAQLFRSNGLVKFISVAFQEVKPSPYYPIPVMGPVLYGTLLGNMGGFITKGVDGYLEKGMPWKFQNGFFIGTFFHLFAHDLEGPLGRSLRSAASAMGASAVGLDDRTFAIVITSLFVQVTGIIMLPQFLGPSFSPLVDSWTWLVDLLSGPLKYPIPDSPEDANHSTSQEVLGQTAVVTTNRVGRGKNKRKKKTS